MRSLGTLVLLEGPDCAGKTTLARRFEEIGFDYLHLGPPTRDDYLREVFTLYDGLKNNAVLDRSHLGEQVYGPVYRGEDTLGTVGRRMMDAYCATRRAVVVVCLPPVDTGERLWRARVEAGGEMFTDGYRNQWEAFCGLRTDLPKLTFDFTAETIDHLMGRYAEARRNHY